VALVTGATSGIGLACAVELAIHGWRVYAGYRNQRKLVNLKQASAGLDIIPVLIDVDKSATVDKAVASIDRREGRLDAVVNNAGFVVAGCWENLTDDDLEDQMETNVFGCLRVARAAARVMRRQGSGRIVNITSVSAFLSTPVMGAYAASKFALSALTETLRLELSPFGIQVGEVAPGFIKTGLVGAVRRSDRSGRPTAYASFYQRIDQHVSREVAKAPPASKVAWVVRYALLVPDMEKRYLVKPSDKFLAFVKWALPDTLWEKIMGISLGV
jgi:NAD(P)-dependent dehydrogenase (short-subunit alcohol dehydrogenase family)